MSFAAVGLGLDLDLDLTIKSGGQISEPTTVPAREGGTSSAYIPRLLLSVSSSPPVSYQYGKKLLLYG